jgi:hypothetical protein
MGMPATKTTICLRQKEEHKREYQPGRKITVRITSITINCSVRYGIQPTGNSA